jgi:hypothetical protein
VVVVVVVVVVVQVEKEGRVYKREKGVLGPEKERRG